MKVKHTPGPWKYEAPFIVAPSLAPRGICAEVCEIFDGGPQYKGYTKHDGYLIAAAPELLEACKQAAAFLRSIEPKDKDYPVIVHLDSAILKAEAR